MATAFPPTTQAIIDRLKALDYSTPVPAKNRKRIEDSVNAHLELLGQPGRQFIWRPNFGDGFKYVIELCHSRGQAAARAAAWDAAWAAARDAAWDAARDAARDAAWDAAWDAARDAAWDAARAAVGSLPGAPAAVRKFGEIERPMLDAFEAGLWLYWITPDSVIAVERPVLGIDDRSRLHAVGAPAVYWPNTEEKYFFHRGVRITQQIAEEPETIKVSQIEKERNAEVRRVMVEKFGMDRYIKESGAKLVHSDDYGKLWLKEQPGDEPLVMVEVVNSTAEPDGTFKDYFLRVDPQLRPLPPGEWSQEKKREWMAKQKPQDMTARNAVASTAGKRGEDYVLTHQT